MALVQLVNVVVLDDPTPCMNPFKFEITFECLQALEDDLEWKVIYVGSAEDSSHDQTLEEVLVGPVPVGVNKFVLESDPADFSSIPENDILGVTVVLVTCSYKDQEFVRVGYYVNNEYTEEYDPEIGPPSPLDVTKVMRQLCSDQPRVTRFPISWGTTTNGGGEMSTTTTTSSIILVPDDQLFKLPEQTEEATEENGVLLYDDGFGNDDELQNDEMLEAAADDDEEDDAEEEEGDDDGEDEIDLDEDEETFSRARRSTIPNE